MRKWQDAHLRSPQAGNWCDRRRIQRSVYYGRQHLAALQGNYQYNLTILNARSVSDFHLQHD